jgi:hypothetical protein
MSQKEKGQHAEPELLVTIFLMSWTKGLPPRKSMQVNVYLGWTKFVESSQPQDGRPGRLTV